MPMILAYSMKVANLGLKQGLKLLILKYRPPSCQKKLDFLTRSLTKQTFWHKLWQSCNKSLCIQSFNLTILAICQPSLH